MNNIYGVISKVSALILIAMLLQACPEHFVKSIEQQSKRIEELRNRKVIYKTGSSSLTGMSDLEKMLAADSTVNYDSLKKVRAFPLKFEIAKIESDDFPKKVSVRALIYDTNGRYVSGLAPPYFVGNGNYQDYWVLVRDSCSGTTKHINKFEVEEIRNNSNIPYAVSFILDHSSSMGNTRIVKLREAVKHVLYAIKPNDMVNIVKFAGKSFTEVAFTDNKEIYRKSFITDKGFNDNIGSGTAMYAAIENVIRQMDSVSDEYKKVIILFSDGGDNMSKITMDSLLRECRKRKIEIYSIAYGYTDDNIRKLAEHSGGRFYPLISSKEFPFAFKDIYVTLNNYYKVSYTPDECYGKHHAELILRLPQLKNIELEATGIYDKSILNMYDNVGTVYLMNIEFDFGQSDIKPESKEQISLIAESLKSNPEMKVRIIGHTDDVGNDEFNLNLSIKRALSVKNELIELGIDANRLEHIGYGKTKPLVPNDNDDNRRRNRRTEFEIISN